MCSEWPKTHKKQCPIWHSKNHWSNVVVPGLGLQMDFPYTLLWDSISKIRHRTPGSGLCFTMKEVRHHQDFLVSRKVIEVFQSCVSLVVVGFFQLDQKWFWKGGSFGDFWLTNHLRSPITPKVRLQMVYRWFCANIHVSNNTKIWLDTFPDMVFEQ